ncbi:MAG: hypothetical protein FJ006_03485 [Chloroflexi bacterium]|nr:hypothetical protein [Chloroflexota bacterium]
MSLAKARLADGEIPRSLGMGPSGWYGLDGIGALIGAGTLPAATGTGRGSSGCMPLDGIVVGEP